MEILKSTLGPEIGKRFGTLTIVDAEEASRDDPALYIRVCREWRELGELLMEAHPPPPSPRTAHIAGGGYYQRAGRDHE